MQFHFSWSACDQSNPPLASISTLSPPSAAQLMSSKNMPQSAFGTSKPSDASPMDTDTGAAIADAMARIPTAAAAVLILICMLSPFRGC